MIERWILVLAMVASAAATADPATVRVNSFPNAKALPLHAGVAKGIFARRGVTLELSFTENSTAQREGLAAGRFDVVHAAVDNAVAWVESHGLLLERYIAAYVESLRWVRRPENRAECAAILMDKLKVSRKIAERTYTLLVDPARGFTPDARFDMEGFRNLLALRAEIEGGADAPQAEKYLDLSYYRRAIGALAKPGQEGVSR